MRVDVTIRINRENCPQTFRSDGNTWAQFFEKHGNIVCVDWVGSVKGWTEIIIWHMMFAYAVKLSELDIGDEYFDELTALLGPRAS